MIESEIGSPSNEMGGNQEPTNDELDFPKEVQMSINLVEDSDARLALENYKNDVLDYVRKLKENPDLSGEELFELKKQSSKALDEIGKHQDKPGVDKALSAIMLGEMTLH